MKKGNKLPKKTGMEFFAERIEEIRKRSGKNQTEFCDYLEVSDRSYRGWTNGNPDYDKDGNPVRKRNEISIDTLISISKRLGVSLDYLLGCSRYETVGNDFIGKQTGLNDDAVNVLKALVYCDVKENEMFMSVINHFLSSDNLESLRQFIRFFIDFAIPCLYSIPVMADSNGKWKKIDNSKTHIALAGSENSLEQNKEFPVDLIPSLTKAHAKDMMIQYIEKIANNYVRYAITQGIVDENYISENFYRIMLNHYNSILPD